MGMDMCYASAAKEFRNQMGGSPDAGSLPQPDGRGVEKWEKVAEEFQKIVGDVEGALRKAEGAHRGKAAEEANASIAEVMPKAEKVSETSKGIRDSLQQQNQNQHEAFQGIPAKGDTLENGREVQIDPPEKGFVDEHKDTWYLGWASDYEERQADHTATNEKATAARERYASQTDNVITALPEFEPEKKGAPPAPPADNTSASSNFAAAESGSGSSGSPASTSSSWASSGSGGGGGAVGGSGGGGGAGGSSGPPPASTGSAWASPGGGSGGGLPPGVVRGKDGSLYRQNPLTGAWYRQGANGRWAPAPGGGPGGAGGGRGAGGAAGGAGGGAGGGSGSGQQPGAGGRSGTGMPGGAGGGAGGAGGGAAGAAGGRGGAGGAMGGAGAGGRGGQGGDEDERERPSWLIEEEDVFSNDMQLVAPPVFGETPGEGR